MANPSISIEPNQFKNILLNQTPLLDVRAPIEFAQGSIPGSINLPLLEDDERELIGTCYKNKGREAAIELGHELVKGQNRMSREQAWVNYFTSSPDGIILCYRGGLRSQTVQNWLAELGVFRPRIEGGYKALRQFLIDEIEKFSQRRKLLVIGGMTGSGKTHLLRKAAQFRPALDLELYAHHRGSAFGGFSKPQPTQIDFENQLALAMLKIQGNLPVLIEDESRLIGRSVQPQSLFDLLRKSPLVVVEESLSSRVESCFVDYITNSPISEGDTDEARATFDRYEQSLHNISKRLGGLRTSECLTMLKDSRASGDLDSNRKWIEKLLEYYYDPLYRGSLEKRDPKIEYSGTWQEVLSYLNSEQGLAKLS